MIGLLQIYGSDSEVKLEQIGESNLVEFKADTREIVLISGVPAWVSFIMWTFAYLSFGSFYFLLLTIINLKSDSVVIKQWKKKF